MSWNVRGFQDDWRLLIKGVRALKPDVLLLQEIPRFPGAKLIMYVFARLCGMRSVIGEASTKGLGIVASPEFAKQVTATGKHMLPRFFVRPFVLEQPRGTVAARINVEGREVVFANIHLALEQDERDRHIDQVLALMGLAREEQRAIVIAGDFNEPPTGISVPRLLDAGLIDAPMEGGSFPAHLGNQKIDFVLHSASLVCEQAAVLTSIDDLTQADLAKVTDHLPLLATFSWR